MHPNRNLCPGAASGAVAADDDDDESRGAPGPACTDTPLFVAFCRRVAVSCAGERRNAARGGAGSVVRLRGGGG